jgi:hypothetical protein
MIIRRRGVRMAVRMVLRLDCLEARGSRLDIDIDIDIGLTLISIIKASGRGPPWHGKRDTYHGRRSCHSHPENGMAQTTGPFCMYANTKIMLLVFLPLLPHPAVYGQGM